MNNKNDVNANWHRQAHYVPAKSGSRLISIHAQPLSLQNVIRAAVRIINGDIISLNAYFSDAGITAHYRKVLVNCASQMEYSHIVKQVQSDHSFCVVIGRLVSDIN